MRVKQHENSVCARSELIGMHFKHSPEKGTQIEHGK